MTSKGSAESARAIRLAGHLALGWSVYLTLMGVWWAAGGAGYPLGPNDPSAPGSGSLFANLGAEVGGPAIALTGAAGMVLWWLLERWQPRTSGQRTALVLAGSGFAVVLVMVVLDGRALYLLPPLGLTVGTWLDADWPTLFQMTAAPAAGCFVGATMAMARRTADRSPAGRARAVAMSRTWERAGRIATYVAMLAPVPYAVIRLCWSRGWAVGAPEPAVEWLLLTQPANVWIEPILAGMALTGALLTSGLLCRWGRIFPRWLPGLRGQRVPLWLPLGLGSSAAMAVFSFGRGMTLGRLGVDLPKQVSSYQAWGTDVSGWEYWGADGLAFVAFPLWGVSLGVALVGYYHRRRLLEAPTPPNSPDGQPQSAEVHMTTTPAPGTLAWFKIATSEPAKFYGSLFDWAFKPRRPGGLAYRDITASGTDGPMGGIANTGGQILNHGVFCIPVANIEASCADAAQIGGSVVAKFLEPAPERPRSP